MVSALKILLDAKIAANFYQYRHEFYDLVVQPSWYYISCDLLPGRRFAVTCDGGFQIPKDKQKNQVSFQVDFNNITGLAESKGTSLKKFYFIIFRSWLCYRHKLCNKIKQHHFYLQTHTIR
ncbi:phage tail domain-containing protein [Bacillus zhangzhouensis]|uniref:Siphovirus-type tail component RIFT-related domain-containing protein n=1 Tax=Bacillus zhangzhouensis TaxID=1178540 RepID=A0A081L6D5_9BACI|nr:hypothetical protein BA70_15095 [Bacillus zhangzhouensis]